MATLHPNGSSIPQKAKSIDDIRLLLEDDLELLTDDELLNAPLPLIEAMLDRCGVARTNFSESTLLACMAKAGPMALPDDDVSEATLTKVLPAKPLGFARSLLAQLREHRRILLRGPAGAGKSLFLHNTFLKDEEVRKEYPRVVFIDCAALRMESIWQFEREAVWAQFGCEDEAFRNFLAGLSTQFGTGSLLALIERRLAHGGLIILDGTDALSRSGEIDAWLDTELFPLAQRLNVAVLLCERAPGDMRSLRTAPKPLDFPALNLDDVDAWLDQPLLRHHQARGPGGAPGLTTLGVYRLTGGAPSLLRDLGNYLLDTALHGKSALRAFARWRIDSGYMADCERFVRAARHSHSLLKYALANGKVLQGQDELTLKQRDGLMATGAVKLTASGRLVFTSPLYALRVRKLLQPANLALGLMRSNLHELLLDGDLHKLRNLAELAGDALEKIIARQKRPREGLEQLRSLLVRWGFEPRLYLRDPWNARLWAPFLHPENGGPFFASQQPHFALAAQTGQITKDDEGRLYLPLTGNSGMVEAVVMGRFLKRDLLPSLEPIEIDRLAGLMRGIRPSLAQVLERFSLRQDQKFQERLVRKAEHLGEPLHDQLLRETGCQSFALLRKSGEQWFSIRFEQTGNPEEAAIGFCWAEQLNSARLTAIGSHPSRRGLTVSGPDAWELFPRLKGMEVTLHLHPDRTTDTTTSLVAFLFAGGKTALDGQTVKQLSLAAPSVLSAAS